MSENNNWWLPEAFSAAVQGLGLSPRIFRKTDCEQVLTCMDEARLLRLVQPLPLSSPSEVGKQVEEAGGAQALFSEAAQAAIVIWGRRHRAVQVLREMSKTVSVLLRAYQQGELDNAGAVLRILPVIAMCAFVPGSEALRQALAAILRGSPEDVPGLIRNSRTVAISGSETVVAVDEQIQADPVWSAWVQAFLKEGTDLVRLCRPATCWEFPETKISEANGQSISHWLFRRR